MGIILSKFCCKKNEKIHFNESLLIPLNNQQLNNINDRINILEKKIEILENNTQNNIKLLSQDIHHINSKLNN